MAAAIVFRGQRASAEVVAGFLRVSGIPLVEVIPPTPYPAGPLGLAFVRVGEEQRDPASLLVDSQRSEESIVWTEVPLWMRFVAELLLLMEIALYA